MRFLSTIDSFPYIKKCSGKTKCIVYPRLHFFSLDLSDYIGVLKHGSFGMSLKQFPIAITCHTDTEKDMVIVNSGMRINNLDYDFDFNKLRAVVKSARHFAVNIEIPESLREHVGIGLSTQIIGGTYLVCAKHCGVNLNINDLFNMGIGHVSTLGLNLLFNPGMLIETGVKYRNKIEQPVNSIIEINDFPFWVIVGIPTKVESLSSKIERKFWDKLLSESTSVTKFIYRELFGECLPAILEKDYQSFCDSLNKIVKKGSKAEEEKIQSADTKEILKLLRSKFGFAAVSSMGPTVYSFSDYNPEQTLKEINNLDYKFYVVKQ